MRAHDANGTIATLTNGEGATVTLQVEHEDKPICIMQVTAPDGDRFVGLKLNKDNRRRLRVMLDLMDY